MPWSEKVLSTNYTWTMTRDYLLAHYMYECYRCGYDEFKPSLHVHHIKPRSNGGSDEFDNLVVICSNCHVAIHHGEMKIDIRDGKISFSKKPQSSYFKVQKTGRPRIRNP